MRLKYLSAFCFALIVPAAAQARPVSYPSGWTVMLRNDATINSAHVHYTPDPKHSIGLRYHSRLGIAPYVAGTGALHTWIMGEGHHRPESSGPRQRDKVGATALLRFFKGPSLLELGVDDQGEPMLNYIHRF